MRIQFNELGDEGAAALLQLDPVADRDESNALIHLLRAAPTVPRSLSGSGSHRLV